MKKFFSKFFNQPKNTGFIKNKTPQRESSDVQTRLSDWLAHPNEYGRRPIYTKIIKTGKLNFKAIPNSPIMHYSLIEYKMTEESKLEIAIVDEMHVWSFLNVINYEAIDIEELTFAYKGKLFEIMESKIRMTTGNKFNFSSENENKKITEYFKKINPEGKFQISDIFKYFDEITFFGFNITNPENNQNILIPSIFKDKENKHLDPGLIYEENNPLLPIAMYVLIGHTLTNEVTK